MWTLHTRTSATATYGGDNETVVTTVTYWLQNTTALPSAACGSSNLARSVNAVTVSFKADFLRQASREKVLSRVNPSGPTSSIFGDGTPGGTIIAPYDTASMPSGVSIGTFTKYTNLRVYIYGSGQPTLAADITRVSVAIPQFNSLGGMTVPRFCDEIDSTVRAQIIADCGASPYYAATNSIAINGPSDLAAIFPTPPSGWEVFTYAAPPVDFYNSATNGSLSWPVIVGPIGAAKCTQSGSGVTSSAVILTSENNSTVVAAFPLPGGASSLGGGLSWAAPTTSPWFATDDTAVPFLWDSSALINTLSTVAAGDPAPGASSIDITFANVFGGSSTVTATSPSPSFVGTYGGSDFYGGIWTIASINALAPAGVWHTARVSTSGTRATFIARAGSVWSPTHPLWTPNLGEWVPGIGAAGTI